MAKHKHDAKSLQHAFIRCAELASSGRVLDLGWGGEPFVAACPMGDSEVCFVSDDIRPVRCSDSTGVASYHLISPAKVPGLFRSAFYHPAGPAAKGQVFHWVDVSFNKLELGATLYLAGQKDRGVLSYVKYVESVFGQVKRIGRTGRMQYFSATKTHKDPGIAPTDIEHLLEASDLPGDALQFKTLDGVFSRDGIDPGSRILLEQVTVAHDAHVMDVGCGYGLLGIACAKWVPNGHVWLGDISARAVVCAQDNVVKNKIYNASVGVSDVYEFAANQQFDLILSNPPFHEGNKTSWPLIDGALERLKPGGELMIVVMRTGAYVKRMQAVFGDVEVCAETSGYSVLRATKKNVNELGTEGRC
ncbi:MAG: class I SAM-dependent methyltransferase [Candidatus Latescibacteria bacterium]|nr:class I SAM-dependent methyltransferase [Candidatus Latescibacterota bacterium]MBT5831071.1 class I SAM-dependent methyltransferase [Candidatus Latescibacterota bacterium]